MFLRSLAFAATVVLLHGAGPLAQAEMTDPYDILEKHYEAIGGLERLKVEKTSYFEATFSIGGLKGTVKYWEDDPYRRRTEVDLKVLTQISGDNGTVAWEVDTNGKLKIERDEGELARREVAARMAAFEHLDRESEIFSLAFDGTAEVDEFHCYVVTIRNSLEETVRSWFVDTTSFLLRKTVSARIDSERHAVFSDFREVGGVLRPFRHDEEILPIGQKQVLTMTTYQVNPEIDPALFEPPAGEAGDFEFSRGGGVAEVPFQYIGDHLFVPVTINCRQSLWALDTGASMSVIDTDFAAALGLAAEGSLKGRGAGHAVDVAFVTLPPFGVPGIEFGAQQVATIAFSHLFRRIYELEVGGILGYDFLSRFVTRVDIANETLAFYHPDSFVYEDDGVILEAPLRGNILTIPAAVDGEFSGRWLLDIGASGVTFHYAYAAAHDFGNRRSVEEVGFGAGGRLSGRTTRFESLELAGFAVRDPLISIPAEEGEGAFRNGEIIGTLGNNLFRHFVLYLDYERQRVIVERGDDFDTRFPEDRSGLRVWKSDPGAPEVFFVSPGTPAAEAGFEEGDLIESINAIRVEHFGGMLAIREMLRETDGTEYDFVVRRDGKQLDLRLKLRDLL